MSPDTEERYKLLGKAKLLDHDDRSMRLKASVTTVEITVLAPDLFRVGMFPTERINEYLVGLVDQ